jgi:hypothetical protein
MILGYDLKNLTETSSDLFQVYKHEVKQGDQVHLKTINSVYVIKVVEEGEYLVSGGWFDRQNLSPHKINIRGCTWGGTAIKTDIIAAPGLCIEFGNNLITSKINKVFYFSYKANN